jgi:acylphosphatase
VDGPVRIEVTVRGRVQGVGFRYFVVRQARRLGLSGWVANEADGSVRAVIEGPTAAVDRIAEVLAVGPPGAIVDDVSSVRMAATGGFDDFGVRPSGHRGD